MPVNSDNEEAYWRERFLEREAILEFYADMPRELAEYAAELEIAELRRRETLEER